MSTIRYFDAPHIARYGMTSLEKGESWIKFWRNGVGFTLEVHQADVKGTSFETRWLDIIEETEKIAQAGPPRWELWNDFCDLNMLPCLPLLQELAPNGKGWRTIGDYIHTPSYKLRLVNKAAAPGLGDDSDCHIIPEVVEGPLIKCSYEYDPAPLTKFAVPHGVARFHERGLSVIEWKNYRTPPYKVQLPDETVAFFSPSEKSVRIMGSDVERNRSHKEIDFYLYIHQLQPQLSPNARIPRLLGIVLSSPAESASEEDLLAGLLLEWIDGESLMYSEDALATHGKHELWKEQISQTVAALHARGVSSLEITPFNILIDKGGSAWLTSFGAYELRQDTSNQAIMQGSANDDLDGQLPMVQLVFDQWLPNAIADTTSEAEQKLKNRITYYWNLRRGEQNNK